MVFPVLGPTSTINSPFLIRRLTSFKYFYPCARLRVYNPIMLFLNKFSISKRQRLLAGCLRTFDICWNPSLFASFNRCIGTDPCIVLPSLCCAHFSVTHRASLLIHLDTWCHTGLLWRSAHSSMERSSGHSNSGFDFPHSLSLKEPCGLRCILTGNSWYQALPAGHESLIFKRHINQKVQVKIISQKV